ncbi:MAG: hypothetical protein ACFFCI_12320 [Promethearchaeota archaeon]
MSSKKTVYFLITLLSLSTFLVFTSYSFGEENKLQTSQGKIFNGLYANYTFVSVLTYNTMFTYNYDTGAFYNVTWLVQGSGTGSWLENIQTRITLNSSGGFGNGVHAPVWVFTNLTVGDNVFIAVDGVGDHPFNVTSELSVTYPGFGSLNIWVLQDTLYPSSLIWYERSTGLLLNGTFIYFAGSYTFTLTATNMFSHYQGGKGGIPGYNVFVIITMAAIFSLIIIKKRKKRL